jgi:hypothetical protein
MGMGSDMIRLMLDLKRAGHLGARAGSLMELGRQQLANSFLDRDPGVRGELKALGEAFGASGLPDLPEPLETRNAHGVHEHMRLEAPHSDRFWKWLGYRYAAIDVDNSEGVLELDLNYDMVPAGHKGRYQLVTNFGTTEHVINQLNAFKVIHDLTAPNGVMIHSLPAGGMMEHGLINYKPKFFELLSQSNQYRIIYLDFRSYPDQSYSLPKKIAELCSPFEADYIERSSRFRIIDGSIVVALKKVENLAFVPPLDVYAGTRPYNHRAAKRYSSVYAQWGIKYRPLWQRWLKGLIPVSWRPRLKGLFSGRSRNAA